MGPLATLLTLPVAGPIGALTWLARQVAENALEQWLDPTRIEIALLALERRLEAGEIDEAAFEVEEAALLEELAEMRAARAAMAPSAESDRAETDIAEADAGEAEGIEP
jgi:hypothetical protein